MKKIIFIIGAVAILIAVIVFGSPLTIVGDEELLLSQTNINRSEMHFSSSYKLGQTFTATKDAEMTRAEIKLSKPNTGIHGDITLQLRDTESNGQPGSNILSQDSMATEDIVAWSTSEGQWYSFDLNYNLQENTKYALVLLFPEAVHYQSSGANYIFWRSRNLPDNGPYLDGSFYEGTSLDSHQEAIDCAFNIYIKKSIPQNNPPDKPVNPKTTLTDDNTFKLEIDVADTDNDLLTVSFYGDNELINMISDIPSGTTTSTIWTNVPYGIHNWYATVSDGIDGSISNLFTFSYDETQTEPEVPVEETPQDTPGFELLILLGAIFIALLITKRR